MLLKKNENKKGWIIIAVVLIGVFFFGTLYYVKYQRNKK